MLFLILLFFCLKSVTLINDGDNIVDDKSQMIYELPTTQKMKHFMAYLCDFNQAEPVGDCVKLLKCCKCTGVPLPTQAFFILL